MPSPRPIILRQQSVEYQSFTKHSGEFSTIKNLQAQKYFDWESLKFPAFFFVVYNPGGSFRLKGFQPLFLSDGKKRAAVLQQNVTKQQKVESNFCFNPCYSVFLL